MKRKWRSQTNFIENLFSIFALFCSTGSIAQQPMTYENISPEQRERVDRLLAYGFTPASGNRSLKSVGLGGISIYDEGKCVPIGHGWIGTPKLPYDSVFGPIGTRGVISENVIKDVTVSVFGDFQLFSDVRPAFRIPIPFMCFGDGAGTRGAPIFQIYVEHTAQAFKKRVVQIEGQNHQVNWRKEKGDPFCPIYGFVDQYWLRRTVVIFRLTFEESKNWNRRPVLACLIRGAMVAMGLPGTISRPSAAVLRTDMPVERLFDGEGFRRTAPEILSPADFLKLNLAPGTRREDAIAQAIELTRADPRVGKDYTGLIK